MVKFKLAKSSFFLSGALSLAVIAGASLRLNHHHPQHVSPIDLLQRAFQIPGSSNVVSVLSWQTRGDTQKAKMVVSKEGKIRITVLQPLQEAGFTIVDDTRTRQEYSPDKKKIWIMSSPMKWAMPDDERIRLIKRNYDVTDGGWARIAGADCEKVILTPKSPTLSTHFLYIEPVSATILRTAAQDPGKPVETVMDTDVFDTVAEVPSDTYSITTLGAVTTVHVRALEPMTNLKDATALLRFKPLIPKHLPLGFIVSGKYLSHRGHMVTFDLELSNGMDDVTIAQLPTDRQGHNASHSFEREGLVTESTKDVLLVVFSSGAPGEKVPTEIQKALLKAVVR